MRGTRRKLPAQPPQAPARRQPWRRARTCRAQACQDEPGGAGDVYLPDWVRVVLQNQRRRQLGPAVGAASSRLLLLLSRCGSRARRAGAGRQLRLLRLLLLRLLLLPSPPLASLLLLHGAAGRVQLSGGRRKLKAWQLCR